MKRIYKTLDLTKINNNNLVNVKNQYNSIVIKQTSDLIKNNISNNEDNLNDRNNNRTFNSIKKPQVSISSVDRPMLSDNIKNVPPQMKISEDFIKKTSGDLSTRLAELENSRRVSSANKPTDIPDFLKPTKVGKEELLPSVPSFDRKLEGFGDMHENFDHEKLFNYISKKENWIMTYNNCEYIKNLYKDYKIIDINWSYGMNKTKDSSEIVIVG
jgi:DNA adenine methylase